MWTRSRVVVLATFAGLAVLAGPTSAGDGQGAAVKVKMTTGFGVVKQGKVAVYTGKVTPKGAKVRSKHLPKGIAPKTAKQKARQACRRDWDGLGAVTVRNGRRVVGTDGSVSAKGRWKIRAKARKPGSVLTATGGKLFATARAGGTSFSAQCSRVSKTRTMP